MTQTRQSEWFEQWSMLSDNELSLFKDWIFPNTMEDFRGKEVLECGCGGGQHTAFMAAYASKVVAVDLNTVEIAKKRNQGFSNVEFVEADIAKMDLGRKFDIVISIGVVHHTDDPDKTIENLKKHVKPGGKLIVWVYSKEGNSLITLLVEPLRKMFLVRCSRVNLLLISRIITLLMYPPIYSLYLLPLRFLPYYEYFQNFRKLSFGRNVLNVFDKLNAPQVYLITESRAKHWFSASDFTNVSVTQYMGVSWRASGVLKHV